MRSYYTESDRLASTRQTVIHKFAPSAYTVAVGYRLSAQAALLAYSLGPASRALLHITPAAAIEYDEIARQGSLPASLSHTVQPPVRHILEVMSVPAGCVSMRWVFATTKV